MRRHGCGTAGDSSCAGARRARDVRVHQLQRVAGLEGQAPGEQLVEAHAERIEIGARGPALRFMRPVCSGDMYASVPSSRLALLATCVSLDSRVAMPKSMSLMWSSACTQEVMRLDVLVDDGLAVDAGDALRHADGDVEESFQRRALVAKHRLQRDVAQVLQHQRHAASMFDQAQRANDLGQVERRQHGVLVAEPRNLCRARMFHAQQLDDHPRAVGVAQPLIRLALLVSRTVSASVYPDRAMLNLSRPLPEERRTRRLSLGELRAASEVSTSNGGPPASGRRPAPT